MDGKDNKKSQTPSAIVIGAGIAGLAAAHSLKEAEFEVVVLESRNRIGGRINTDYSFGFPVDLGASWLHGVAEENPLAPLIGRLGLPLYRTSEDDSVLFDHDLESYAIFDADGNQVPQELVKEMGLLFEEILEKTEELRDASDEDMSIAKGISTVMQRNPKFRKEGIAHDVLQWYLCRMEGWFATDADTISLKNWDSEELLPGGHGIMVRGYRPVINTLAKGLDIRQGHRVVSVARRTDGVQVTVETGSTFTADAAVIAVPLGVLKADTVQFQPALPPWKDEAIRGIAVGVENKIILHFRDVFWPNVEFIGVVSPTSYGCSYFLNLHKATGHPVLVYMSAGRLAREMERMTNEAAVEMVFQQLKKILPAASVPIQYLVSRWGSDRDSLGSYTYDGVGQPREYYERLRIPVDNLFFAGEATSAKYTGTVHGAYSTGVMAAEECRMRVVEKFRCVDVLESSEEEEEVVSVPLLISKI